MCKLRHQDGKTEEIELIHSFNAAQINWFYAGSALNMIRNPNMH
jgi:aconitase A